MECSKLTEFLVKRYEVLSNEWRLSINFKDLLVVYRKCSEGWLMFYKPNKPVDSNQLKVEKVRVLFAKS